MAGLLDFVANDPEARLGISLLAGASPRYGRGLLGMLETNDRTKQGDLQRQLLQSQITENQAQAEMRQQQALMAQQAQAAKNGLLSGAAGGEEGGIMGLAKRLGIPPEAIQADVAFNGGKKISELLESRSKPNWQNIGGNLVNTNAPGFSGGIQDQVQMGPDGRAMILRTNNGNPVMGAVQGSFDTYSAFKDIDNRTSARYSPGRPVIGPDGRQYGQSQLDEIGGAAPRSLMRPSESFGARTGPTNAAERGMAEEVGKVPYDLQREIASVERDLRGNSLSGLDRAQATAYLQQLRGQGQSAVTAPSGATGALGFSPAEQAAQEAARVRAIDTAKADVTRDTGRQSEAKLANKLNTGIDRALELLKEGPTSSLAGNAADKALGVFGMSTPGGEKAAQLETLSGWLVSNVPRMEGPQSNMDVLNYQTMAGRIGDRNLPIGVRMKAAEEVKKLQNKYSDLNEPSKQAQGGATGSWGGPSKGGFRIIGVQ